MSTLPDNDNGRDEPMVFIVIGKAYETDNLRASTSTSSFGHRTTIPPCVKH